MKTVPGFEGLYAVTKNGRVWTYARRAKGAVKYHIKGRFLTPQADEKGYLHVNLVKDGKIHVINVHRLIAKAFIPNPNNVAQVNHKNAVKSDNRVQNLEWCTAKQNSIHAIKVGVGAFGERNGMSKLTEADAALIRELYAEGNLTYRALGQRYGVTYHPIYAIVHGKTWKHVPSPST
jgi:hypothetical protein